MNLSQKLNLALTRSGYAPLKKNTAFRKIGAAAWHDAYLVYPCEGSKLVVRLRKRVIYGRERVFDPAELHEDYAPVGLYYRHANRCRPGICPTVYTYHLDPTLTFTIESYMGPALALARLTETRAFDLGEQMGRFFRAMHDRPAPLPGFGALVWREQQVKGADQRPMPEIARTEQDRAYEQFEQLSRSDLPFDRAALRARVAQVLTERPAPQVTLANGDITPENLIVRRGRFSGLIDPVPRLEDGLRYAAFFLYCYRSFLPSLANAPRYAHHRFQSFLSQLKAIADGYQAGYTQGDSVVIRALRREYFLWGIEIAHQNLQRLAASPTPELFLRAGDRSMMAARLRRSVRELAEIRLD